MSTSEAKCYLQRYGDLRTAYGTDTDAAKMHWKRLGLNEGRNKSCDAV